MDYKNQSFELDFIYEVDGDSFTTENIDIIRKIFENSIEAIDFISTVLHKEEFKDGERLFRKRN